MKEISYDELYDLYIVQNKSSEEVAKELNINKATFFRKIKKYNIKKDDNAKSILLKQHNVQKINLCETAVIDYYINKNHTKEETAIYFGVSEPTISRLLRENRVYKDKEKSQYNRQQSILKNNGYICALSGEKRKEIQDKINNTAWSNDVREKRKQTNIERYGVINPIQNEFVKDKLKSTVNEKYGVDCVLKYQNIREKIQKTNIEKYGVENYSTFILSKKAQSVLNSEDSLKQYIIESGNNTTNLIANDIDCALSTIVIYLHKYNLWNLIDSQESRYEKEVLELLSKLNINNYKTREILPPLEIDFYCPDYNIGIEFNGDYWHSSFKKDKSYHFNKSRLAEEKGVRLIHIWEHEWNNPKLRLIIESLLKIGLGKIENRIYARNCEVREITNEEAKPFNEINHLQGHRNAQITYGLFYNNKLVQLMSFSRTKYNKNLKDENSWEIIRGCPGSNNIVVGGVSKLFQHFIREQNPDYIFSYCDFNKFDGKGYEAIGMKFIGYTGPDMKWLMSNGTVVNRSPSRHKELKENSIAQLWGAGSKKYLWSKT